MVEYIKQLIRKIKQENDLSRAYLVAVREELERLDPRDFEPQVQHEVVWYRVRLGLLAEANRTAPGTVIAQLDAVLQILDKYRGEGSRGVQRSFAYITDPDLRAIIERDYFELTVKLFPGGAWKSTVILAGSILEAILFDRLADAKWNTKAVASPAAQTKGTTPKPIPMKDWRLENLIDIAVDITLLPTDPADTIHQILRDYRNFVHPKKELRAAHACTEAEAMLAVGALDSVCNYIEKHP